MSDTKITTPLAQNQTNQCLITPPWFVSGSEYHCLLSSFKPLVNGQEAFAEVHRAIAGANQSVYIICWGFQPSMYFIRDGASPSIGCLLEQIGDRIDVKILSYAVDPLWLGINITGAAAGESNTPGRRLVHAWNDRPPTSTDEQYQYDQLWYLRYGEKQTLAEWGVKKSKGEDGKAQASRLRFVTRGFSPKDRTAIARQEHLDSSLSISTKSALTIGPSHHQKMVLIDHQDPKHATGFVMGHNMLDEYWDQDGHTFYRHFHCHHGKPEPAPNRYPNGRRPRQDISSKVTGAVVGDLFLNFAQAWKKETGESLTKSDFRNYPLRLENGDTAAFCQILRTQPQHKVQDIKKCYLQAVNNASRYIYIENQYFRWPPLAEKIKAAAKAQTNAGRKPETHGSLNLFVVTNADDEGMGAGVMNTYRMLDSLGRADTIPGVARKKEIDIREQNLEAAQKRQTALEEQVNASTSRQWGHFGEDHMKLLGEANRARDVTVQAQKELDTSQAEILRSKRAGKKERTILPQERPGLKVHVCTLVAPDSPAGVEWLDVYIHAKLMLIDDAFLTLGSANINTRSMEVDSELNIALDRPEISKALRQRLWGLHTGDEGAQIDPAQAFKKWAGIMQDNKTARDKKQAPVAPLIEFYRGSAKIADKD